VGVKFKMKRKINLVCFGVILLVLFSLISLVSACDEVEMQTTMTGNVIGDSMSNVIFSDSLGILSLIKELLVVIVLVLLIIFLIKQVNRKWK